MRWMRVSATSWVLSFRFAMLMPIQSECKKHAVQNDMIKLLLSTIELANIAWKSEPCGASCKGTES